MQTQLQKDYMIAMWAVYTYRGDMEYKMDIVVWSVLPEEQSENWNQRKAYTGARCMYVHMEVNQQSVCAHA